MQTQSLLAKEPGTSVFSLPKVSVLMNCLNGERYLREAIDSVFNQTYEDWEIIFWEDAASTDGSAAVAKSYGGKLRYFRGSEPLPLYGARNLALEKARGEYIAFLDCDDRWLPRKLQLQMKAFEKRPNLGMVYTNVQILEQNGDLRRKYYRPQPSGRIFRQLIARYNLNLQSVMVARKALESEPYPFDRQMLFSGDADLFVRLAHQWEAVYLPEVTVVYREHGTSLSAKRVEVVPKENERMLVNLEKRFPGFLSRYSGEVRRMRERARLSVFVSKWKYASGREARRYLLKERFTPFFFGGLYLISFFPYRALNFFRKIIRVF